MGSNENDSGSYITIDSAGKFVITGSTMGGIEGFTNLGVYTDVFLVKYNSSGAIQ